MKIGGYVPFTLGDYPGRPAAIVFTQGCNFRCPFCHNGALLPEGPGRLPEAEVLARLTRRRGVLAGIVVSGGEPTLQPDVADFCAALKVSGFAVKLDTNGSRPDVLRALLAERLVDYVAMDVKAPPGRYSRLAGVPGAWPLIAESIQLVAESGVPHEFRTTVVPALLADRDLGVIRALLPASSQHVLQTFRPDLARDSALRAHASSDEDTALTQRVDRETVQGSVHCLSDRGT